MLTQEITILAYVGPEYVHVNWGWVGEQIENSPNKVWDDVAFLISSTAFDHAILATNQKNVINEVKRKSLNEIMVIHNNS